MYRIYKKESGKKPISKIMVITFAWMLMFSPMKSEAKIPIEQIKGLDSPLTNEYKHLSPLSGIV